MRLRASSSASTRSDGAARDSEELSSWHPVVLSARTRIFFRSSIRRAAPRSRSACSARRRPPPLPPLVAAPSPPARARTRSRPARCALLGAPPLELRERRLCKALTLGLDRRLRCARRRCHLTLGSCAAVARASSSASALATASSSPPPPPQLARSRLPPRPAVAGARQLLAAVPPRGRVRRRTSCAAQSPTMARRSSPPPPPSSAASRRLGLSRGRQR